VRVLRSFQVGYGRDHHGSYLAGVCPNKRTPAVPEVEKTCGLKKIDDSPVSPRRSLNEAADRAMRMVERQKIADALAQCDGNKTRAAEVLAVSYKTLLTKIKDYNL